MNDPAHPWPEFPDHVSRFYGRADAVALYHRHIRAIVGRTNKVTGTAYANDPTIMAWQLANEPRPAGQRRGGAGRPARLPGPGAGYRAADPAASRRASSSRPAARG